MHVSLMTTLLALSLGAAGLRGAPQLPARLVSLASALEMNRVDVGQWRDRRPWRCSDGPATQACKLIKRSWENLLDVPHGRRSYSVELWAIPPSSPAAAKRLIRLLQEDDEFGGTFGKAPETHFLCHDTVLATVGTYRGPRPHARVDRLVRRWVAAHCGAKPK